MSPHPVASVDGQREHIFSQLEPEVGGRRSRANYLS